MSAKCIFILRNTELTGLRKRRLRIHAMNKKCGINFMPQSALLSLNQIKQQASDTVFELCDTFQANEASLLLSYENYSVNGKKAKQPLQNRLQIIHSFAVICLSYADCVEIYISDDNPAISDYVVYKIPCDKIINTIYNEYQSDTETPILPCIRLILTGIT